MQKTINNQHYLKLLAWLKAARLEQGLTMRELGASLNQPHSFVGKIETAERRLDIAEYVEYCQVLNIDPHEGINFLLKS